MPTPLSHCSFALFAILSVLAVISFGGNFVKASVSFSSGKCVTLPQIPEARLVNPCVGVVTYPFYLFAGQDPSSLQAKVNGALNNSFLLQDPTLAANYVRHVCAQVYLKCQPHVILSNSSTYNYQLYQSALSVNYGVPFQRPCMSACVAMLQAASPLSAIFLQLTPSTCQATFDYSFGDVTSGIPLLYDPSDNTTFCYVPTLVPVGGLVEKYAGGFCDGLLDEIIVPPANALDASLTLLQLPGVSQALYGQVLQKVATQLPVWLDPDCHRAFKQFICMPMFPAVQHITAQSAIDYSNIPAFGAYLNSLIPGVTQLNITVPSYPAQKYCESYCQACVAFLTLAGAMPTCTALTLPGTPIRQYPSTRQPINTISTPFGTLMLPSDPNTNAYFNVTEYGTYAPNCPSGYVIPDHPTDENVQWIPGSGCADACQSRLWETTEWDQILMASKIIAVLGMIAALINLIYLVSTKQYFEYYLMTGYTIANFICSTQSVYVSNISSFEEKFCHGNAINALPEYGAATPCMVQAGMLSYVLLLSCAFIALMTIQYTIECFAVHYQVYLKSPIYIAFQVIFGFGLPAIPVIYNGVHEQFGFFKTVPMCFVMTPPWSYENENPATSALPIFIVYCLTFLLYLYCIIRHWYAPITPVVASPVMVVKVAPAMMTKDDTIAAEPMNNSSSSSSSWWWYRLCLCLGHPYIWVLLFSTILFIPYICAGAQLYEEFDKFTQSYIDWTKCVFQYYTGTTDSYEQACGKHASYRPGPILGIFQVLVLTANMIFITPPFIISHVYLTYGGFVPFFSGSGKLAKTTAIRPLPISQQEC